MIIIAVSAVLVCLYTYGIILLVRSSGNKPESVKKSVNDVNPDAVESILRAYRESPEDDVKSYVEEVMSLKPKRKNLYRCDQMFSIKHRCPEYANYRVVTDSALGPHWRTNRNLCSLHYQECKLTYKIVAEERI